MSNLQKWLIIIAIWIFAVGILFNGLRGRYKMPILYDVDAKMHPDARYDTWTGKLQVWEYGYRHYETGATSWVKDLK